MTWLNKPWCGFDTETTGVDPEVDRIVTAAVVDYDGGRPARVRTWLADPGVPIPAGATAVHGYTSEAACAAGRPPGEVVAEVIAALAAAADTGRPLVVMNAPFDLTLIDREAERHGIRSLFDTAVPCVLDPRVLDKHIDPYRPGHRRLEDLCAFYGVRHGDAHDAAADAVAACAVTAALVDDHPELAAMPLDVLHEQQARWAAGQQDDLREHFAATPGKTSRALGVRLDWPLVPRMRPAGFEAWGR